LKSAPECIPCSVRQVLRTAKMAGLGEEAQKKAMREAMRVLAELDHGVAPAVLATKAIRAAQDLYEDGDPFERIKWETTVEALAMYQAIKPDVMKRLTQMDPVGRIRYFAKLAAAGNIIDFGISSEFDLEETLKDTLQKDLAIDHSDRFYREMASGRRFLLISDNAGEIVFDRFLLDEAVRLGKEVYVAVKSGGILNDATVEDALRAGITGPVKIVETGSSSLGLMLKECTPEFRRLFREADVVLSKGQANYETLDEASRSIFFILRVKCPIIAEGMAIPTGASILMHHPGAPRGQS
jgi:uncharacterized protein with ATP-grasp and redox domains